MIRKAARTEPQYPCTVSIAYAFNSHQKTVFYDARASGI